MKKIFIPIIILLLISGCTTVRYNSADTLIAKVDYPELGKVMTAFLGDNLVRKGTIVE